MSDQCPDIALMDRVRVMQTNDMVREGLANKKGVVLDLGRVLVISFDDGTTGYVDISSVMREPDRTNP